MKLKGSKLLKTQDELTAMAVEMAAAQLEYTRDYIMTGRWRTQQGLKFLKAIAKSENLVVNEPPPINDVSDSSGLFDLASFSNDQSRIHCSNILASQSRFGDKDWLGIADLPEPILTWLRGQEHILFYDLQRESFEAIIETLQKRLYGQIQIFREGKSFGHLILEIVKVQHQHLEEIKNESGVLDQRQDLWHSSFGRNIEIGCAKCGESIQMDSMPRWAAGRSSQYICPDKTCQSDSCKAGRRSGTYRRDCKPVDTRISWIRGEVKRLERSRRKTVEQHDSLRKATDTTENPASGNKLAPFAFDADIRQDFLTTGPPM